MLIYTKNMNWEYLKQCIASERSITQVVDSHIPDWCSHIDGIYDNQRYYAAIYLRRVLSLPFKPRMNAVRELCENIAVKGLCTTFISIEELLSVIDKDKLIEALEEDFYGR